MKPKTESHVAEQFSWVPLPSCPAPGCPFPIKSLALSTCVSPQTIHFWVLDKSPLLVPLRATVGDHWTRSPQEKFTQSALVSHCQPAPHQYITKAPLRKPHQVMVPIIFPCTLLLINRKFWPYLVVKLKSLSWISEVTPEDAIYQKSLIRQCPCSSGS